MTKQDEINVLCDAIEKLGDDSYLAPWLKSVIHEVEHSIRSDYFPSIIPSETARQCAEIKREATEHATNIVAQAEAKRSEIVKDTENKAEHIRINLRRDLQKALNIV